MHKINGTDGSIIWRLNGKSSDFDMAEGTKFCFQHHARWLEQAGDVEIISLYDNSAHGTEHNGGSEVHTAPTSSGKVLHLNTTSWVAELVGAYFPPDDLLSKSQGSTQVLPGGNVLVGWGSEGAVTEFTSDGTPVFHAYMDSGFLGAGVQNYRAFRFNWTGLPSEDPAIAALEDDEATTLYVSWNGDTETTAWRFYAVTDDHGSRDFLGEVPRSSFETRLKVTSGKLTAVAAEAVDIRGTVLRITATVKVERDFLPTKSHKTGATLGDTQHIMEDDSNWAHYAILKVMRLRFFRSGDL